MSTTLSASSVPLPLLAIRPGSPTPDGKLRRPEYTSSSVLGISSDAGSGGITTKLRSVRVALPRTWVRSFECLDGRNGSRQSVGVTHQVVRCPKLRERAGVREVPRRFRKPGIHVLRFRCDRHHLEFVRSGVFGPANDQHPWTLDAEARGRVEAAVVGCPHGGRFRFDALPRCPRCLSELPVLADSPYFVVLADRIDGEAAERIWRSEWFAVR